MNINELRIGNRVIDNGEICEVIQIEANGNVMTTCKSRFPISNIEDLEPIPITEKLLLTCGFKSINNHRSDGIHYYYKDFGLIGKSSNYFYGFVRDTISKDGMGMEPFTVVQVSSNELLYVHQLQNLYYSITGKQLIIYY